MATQTRQLSVVAELWLSLDGRNLASARRVDLPAEIARLGSVTQAAKAVGLSYKGAWTAIEDMINLARAPLMHRTVGGKGGGNTRLTRCGANLVRHFEQIARKHSRFMGRLNEKVRVLIEHN